MIHSSTWLDQFKISLWRTTLLQRRYWTSTLAQTIIAPFIFTLLIFLLQQVDYSIQSKSNAHPLPSELSGVAACQGKTSSKPCITLMYHPTGVVNGVNYTQILQKFSDLNSKRIGRAFIFEDAISSYTTPLSKSLDIVPVPSADFIYNYTLFNPNTTKWGISFNTTSPNNIQYQVWVNYTNTQNISSGATDVFGRDVLSLTRGLDEAIISVLNDQVSSSVDANINVKLKDWPLVAPSTLSDTVVQQLGPVFFFCSEMVIFINVISLIVSEKELMLRHGMELMGLKPIVYWSTQFISNSLLVFINAFVTTIFGWIFRFSAFTNANFGVQLFTFFLFGEAMVVFAFFLSTFVREVRQAISLGIFFFIIGLVFESFVFSSAYVGYLWWSEVTVDSLAWKILIQIPFFNFGHMFLDITTYATGTLDLLTDTYIPGPGFPWANLYEPIPKELLITYSGEYPAVPPPVHAWYYLIMNILVYGTLTWYLDNVIPDVFGSSKPFYFFLLPGYWGISSKSQSIQKNDWLKKISSQPTEEYINQDDDVEKERELALNPNVWPAVKIIGLRKVFKPLFELISKVKTKVAVKNSSFNLEEGKLLALLGQNGAGKTTTISMLSGLTPATSGDALLYGFSVSNQIYDIRKIMGICPQHDILFDDLTAREHIELYAGLKGVDAAGLKELIEVRLKIVKLDSVADIRAVTYSGGMKRRLSLVIATIGDPKIIFLDEPTTGMDPVNRRHVWSFIERFKKGRVIVLTTHSMEEADVLGDRISIMSKGEFKAIGNSIHLKNKFGSGYRITIIADPDNVETLKSNVTRIVPEAHLDDQSAGAIIYQFPPSSLEKVPLLVEYLEGCKNTLVKNWGISQSTLEEVFLKLIREN